MSRSTLLALLVSITLSAESLAQSTGKPTPLTEIPEPVLTGAKRDAPEIQWQFAFTFRDARTWYRLVGKDRSGRNFVYNANADGSLIDVGTEQRWQELPFAVRAAIQRKDSAFQPSLIVTVGKKVGQVTSYKLDGKSAGGKEKTYLVSADGSRVSEPPRVEAKPAPVKPKKK